MTEEKKVNKTDLIVEEFKKGNFDKAQIAATTGAQLGTVKVQLYKWKRANPAKTEESKEEVKEVEPAEAPKPAE